MSAKGRNLRSKDIVGMDRNELVNVMREVIREELSTALDIKLQPIQKTIDAIHAETTENVNAIRSLEEHATDTDRRLLLLEGRYKAIETENVALKQKIGKLETYSRRFNIRVLGLQEGVEKGNPTSYLNTLLMELFGVDKVGAQPLVCIAHRTGRPGGDNSESTHPRCVIVKLFSLETRNLIVRLAGEMRSNRCDEEEG